MNYITILDFEAGRVFQYEISNYNTDDCELILAANGHNLSNCEWMQHENPQVITN